MKIYICLFLVLFFMGCHPSTPRQLQQSLKAFEAEMLDLFPDYAAAMGQETDTEILILPTAEQLAAELDFCKKYERIFTRFQDFEERPDLNDQRKEKIEFIRGMILRMTGRQSPYNNPGFYNVYPALARRIFQIKNNEPDGLERLNFTLRKVPDYFLIAKENLQDPDLAQTATSIALQKSTIEFLSGPVMETIDEVIAIEGRERLEAARVNALIAVKDYHAFCNSIWIELKKLE